MGVAEWDEPRLRWMVRREVVVPSQFAVSSAVVAWSVTAYVGRRSDGQLVAAGRPVPFPSRLRALAWARSEAERVCRSRQSHGSVAGAW